MNGLDATKEPGACESVSGEWLLLVLEASGFTARAVLPFPLSCTSYILLAPGWLPLYLHFNCHLECFSNSKLDYNPNLDLVGCDLLPPCGWWKYIDLVLVVSCCCHLVAVQGFVP